MFIYQWIGCNLISLLKCDTTISRLSHETRLCVNHRFSSACVMQNRLGSSENGIWVRKKGGGELGELGESREGGRWSGVGN